MMREGEVQIGNSGLKPELDHEAQIVSRYNIVLVGSSRRFRICP